MSLNEQVDRYAWVDAFEALTVAIIQGLSADEVLRTYGADPAHPKGVATFAQAPDLAYLGDSGEESNLMIVECKRYPAVIALENDGYSGGVPEIARRCSANGGQFFSVYWNVNAFGLVIEAIDGKITAYFEHLYPLAPNAEASEVRPSWAIGEEIDVSAAKAACFALMEQRTGVAFDQDWLNDQRPVYAIPEPHKMFEGVDGVDQP